jgi:hypothetical protein
LQNLEPKLEGYRLLIAGSLVRLQPAPPGFSLWHSGFSFKICEAVAERFNATVVRKHQPSSVTCSSPQNFLEPID